MIGRLLILLLVVHAGTTTTTTANSSSSSSSSSSSITTTTTTTTTTNHNNNHTWADHALAKYQQHVAQYRTNRTEVVNDRYMYWDAFRPAFTCPLIERLGDISEGGKWVCNYQALRSLREDGKPCNIFSFGIAHDTSFEESLMKGLNGSCKLWGFDPTVKNFPPTLLNKAIPGEKHFSRTALLSNETNKRIRSNWDDVGDLETLMMRHGVDHIDLLKIDIEDSEWLLFESLCKIDRPIDRPLPFDFLSIELHSTNGKKLESLVSCLDRHGIYPFSREENLHRSACRDIPTRGVDEVEMSFVRADSIFAHSQEQEQPHARMAKLEEKAISKREAYIQNRKSHMGGNGNGWGRHESWRCSKGPMYLWDMFEARHPCANKHWVQGWPQGVVREVKLTGARVVCGQHHRRRHHHSSSSRRLLAPPPTAGQHRHHSPQQHFCEVYFSFSVISPKGSMDYLRVAEDVANVLHCSNYSINAPAPVAVPYRILFASVSSAEEWLLLKEKACNSEELHLLDQLVLTLTLVGKDISGPHADSRRRADLASPSLEISKAWGSKAAALLGPIVHCLEFPTPRNDSGAPGFRLASRELLYNAAAEVSRAGVIGTPPALHSATMTFLQLQKKRGRQHLS